MLAANSRYFFSLQLLAVAVAVAVSWSGSSEIGVEAFIAPHTTTSLRFSTTRTVPRSLRSTLIVLSNNDDDDNNNNNNNNNFDFDFDLLPRRFERADKIEIRNDATLVACYALCRFLIYDITSGVKIAPGWGVQDWIWLTGTFSSATVLVVYYIIAGLLSRSFEYSSSGNSSGQELDTSSPTIRAIVNVALCCPVWLATEHLLGFGPSDIGGGSLSVAVATGFIGFGSFMALAKTLITLTGTKE
jgi:hypothetical protein